VILNIQIYTSDREDIMAESGSICIRDLPKSHRIKIISIKNLYSDGDMRSPKYLLEPSNAKAESGKQEIPFVFITAEIYHGGILVGPTLFRLQRRKQKPPYPQKLKKCSFSNAVPDTANPTWNQWIFQPFSAITIRNIPEVGLEVTGLIFRLLIDEHEIGFSDMFHSLSEDVSTFDRFESLAS